ncbi:MAG: hypothetical protein ACJ716_15660 [Marmoricola sp.]
MPRNRTSARRRQRSVRVTVAVVLLTVATVAVLAALPTQSPALLSVAAVTSVALGWASVRIVWTEVLQSRRENATDRAATATAYKSLFSQRAAEHAEFTTAMTERLAESNKTLHEYQGAMVQAQSATAAVQLRAETAESALSAAQVRVAELERSIELLRADDVVEDLVAFDEKIAEATAKVAQEQAAKLA